MPHNPFFDKISRFLLNHVLTFSVLTIIAGGAIYVLYDIEKRTRHNMAEALETVLLTTQETLHIWFNDRLALNWLHVLDPEFVQQVKELLFLQDNQSDPHYEKMLKSINKHLSEVAHLEGARAYHIVSSTGIKLVSSQEAFIGTKHVIAEQKPELLDELFQGLRDTFVPTLKREFHSYPHEHAMYIASALTVQDETIAVLLMEFDPHQSLSKITELGQIGLTGETYAFDELGLMVSESRFNEHLSEMGRIAPDEKSMSEVSVVVPSGAKKSGSGSDEMPKMTLAVQHALQHKTMGKSAAPYLDYRGVKVLGAWLWDDVLDIGLITEIDLAETLLPYRETRRVMLLLLGLTMGLTLLLRQSAVRAHHKHTQEMMHVNHELEVRVQKRTLELMQAHSALELANKRLEKIAATDDLTGLANRRKFDEVLNQSWQQSILEHTTIALIFMDIDCFKVYNDTFGHQTGDRCLEAIGKLLSGLNIGIKPGEIKARYGGEEFVLLLTDTSSAHALKAAERIRVAIAQMKICHPQPLKAAEHVTASLGVAVAPHPSDPLTVDKRLTIESFIRQADTALYQAKMQGRNRIVLYQTSKEQLQESPSIAGVFSPYGYGVLSGGAKGVASAKA